MICLLIRIFKTYNMEKCMICTKMTALLNPCKTCVRIVCKKCLTDDDKEWGESKCIICTAHGKSDIVVIGS